jgi:hypothetical protein
MAKKKRAVEDDEDEAPVRRKKKRPVDDDAPRRSKRSSGDSGVSTVVTLDFSKDTSEGRKKFKEGDYPFKVKSIKMGKSEQKGTPYCQVNLVHAKGSKYAGDPISDRVYVTDAALWRIRALFAACGKPIPKKKTKIDFSDLVGSDLWATIIDDEYTDKNDKSRVKSIVGDYLEEEPDEDDDDDDDEDDDEDDEDDDDLEDMDVDDDL